MCAFDAGQVVSLASFHDPNIAAVLLKSFFRDLPDPVFPESIYPLIKRCPPPVHDPSDRSCVDYIRDTILPAVERISPATVIVLSYVLREL
jgi:Rho GTPase-activating protein 1